jgi:phosphoribosylamine-glycine ligase
MQSLNILVVADNTVEYLFYIKNSKFLNKLFVTYKTDEDGVFSIDFNTFQGLAEKCKALQIDIVLVNDEKWILQGIGDVMKKNHINCFAPTSFWTNLELSNEFSRSLLEKYSIKLPRKITLPVEFPVIVKTDGETKIANSIQETIQIQNTFSEASPDVAKTLFIEEFIEGEKVSLTSLFDGKNLATFNNEQIPRELIVDYSKKLKEMLYKEGKSFIGFINSDFILRGNILYNTGFSFKFDMPNTKLDLLYILQLAIYQKLDELKF